MTLFDFNRKPNGQYLLMFRENPLYRRLFGLTPQVRTFVGICTVWHELPHMRRCSTFMESNLADVYVKLEYWRNEGVIPHFIDQ